MERIAKDDCRAGSEQKRDTDRRSQAIAYWMTTGLLAAELLAGGILDVTWRPYVVGVVTRLGYPAYILTIVGAWKLLAVPALLAPGFPRLKEWAYAGVFFEMSGAVVSHAACGKRQAMIAPLVLTALGMASWWLRPQSRTFAAPLFSGMRTGTCG